MPRTDRCGVMDEKSANLSVSDETTIEDELRQWPQSIDTEVAAAAAKGREQEAAAARKSRTRRGLLIVALILAVGIAVLIPIWLYMQREPGRGDNVAIAQPPLAKPPLLERSTLEVGQTDNAEDYKQTTATISENGEQILDVVQYEFYASKFIVNNTKLNNQSEMVDTFLRLRGALTDNWIVIFTAASVEGHEDYNLGLCRNRLYAIRDMISKEAVVSVRGFWGILAGEYEADLSGIAGEQEEEREEAAAAQNGEKWLSQQRSLIVITIKERKPLPANLSDRVPVVVAEHLYKKGIIPKDYDNSSSTPFRLGR